MPNDARTGGDGMNQELIEQVAMAMCQLGPLSTTTWEEIEDAGRDEYRSDAMAAVRAVGDYLVNAVPDDSADDVREALGL